MKNEVEELTRQSGEEILREHREIRNAHKLTSHSLSQHYTTRLTDYDIDVWQQFLQSGRKPN